MSTDRSPWPWIAGGVLVCGGLVACSAVLGFEDLRAPSEGAEGGTSDAPPPVEPGAVAAITITASGGGPSTFGEEVTFTAFVSGNRGAPTGTVTFTDGATVLGAFPLEVAEVASTAKVRTTALAGGPHNITATYRPKATYPGALASLTHTVKAVSTALTLTTPSLSSVGQPVTWTASVTSKAVGVVTGMVTFKEGAETRGTGPLSGGIATFTTADLPLGLHTFEASYAGNANFAASNSAPVTHAVTGPRCEGVAPTCGLAGSEDCCASAPIPNGVFKRSYDGVNYPTGTNTATVGDFTLDTYEITVSRFRTFMQAGKGTRASPPAAGAGALPGNPSSGWNASFDVSLSPDTAALRAALRSCTFPSAAAATWTDSVGANESKPINCITWFDAFAFCIWDGGRLPTESEWNYAAAGGDEQRQRPWGAGVDPSYAVYEPSVGPSNVGSKPPGNGKWGHADLAGNVWEWSLDAAGTYPLPCNNCARLTGGNRSFRGGGWFYSASPDTYASERRNGPADYRGADVGARCARAP